MWRFIVVTFSFLGWAFYELSDGADYAPRDGSRQAMLAERPDVEGQTALRAALARHISSDRGAGTADGSDTRIVLASANAGAADAVAVDSKRIKLTLSRQDNTGRDTARALARLEKVARLTKPALPGAEGLSAGDQAALAIAIVRGLEARPAATNEPVRVARPAPTADQAVETAADIREVSGTRVNMRSGPGTSYDVVDKLTRGMRVVVLDDNGDGWVKLQVEETGTRGWMADFLLVASN